jgi:hypothetical protein
MRLFYFLLILILPTLSWAQNCTEATITGPGTFNCSTLTISSDLNIVTAASETPILKINVTGDVIIKANITLNGNNGASDFTNGSRTFGGPGAGDGGGANFGATENATNPDGFGGRTTLPPDGETFAQESPCGSGGGGGAFALAGGSGAKCATSSLPNNGGDAVTSEFDFTLAAFRGGFGGGAGAYGDALLTGAGGGGGGALHIDAGGTITVNSGATISARGGSGGANTSNGGGGGGGSGGAIWLVSANALTMNGAIDVRGGSGGMSSLGAHGGNGSNGRFRLESPGKVTEGSGFTNFGSSGSKSFNSSISCATIAEIDKNKNNFFQVLTGFSMAFIFGFLFKILFRFRGLTLVKSVYRN